MVVHCWHSDGGATDPDGWWCIDVTVMMAQCTDPDGDHSLWPCYDLEGQAWRSDGAVMVH